MSHQSAHPTLADIARIAGVSTMTASRVIADKPGVTARTREQVLSAAQQLGYVPNRAARQLARGQTNVIGLVTSYIGSPYIAEILAGIESALRHTDNDLVIYNVRQVSAERRALALFGQGMVDGLLIASQITPEAEALLTVLQHKRVPFVLIDQSSTLSSIGQVIGDNRKGMSDATRYLLQIGHRRIAFFAGPLDLHVARERLAGFRAAMAAAGAVVDESLIREAGFSDYEAARHAHELLALPDRPTAILASNDDMALAVMTTALRLGLRVPQDLSVIGFDDIPPAAHSQPALTTVSQQLRLMGQTAAELLLDGVKSLPMRPVTLPNPLMLRDSCAPPNA
jgi:LacI family transcriptional regulator